jgi:hypothetical protein
MRQLIRATILGIIAFCIYPVYAQIPGYVQGDENYTLTLAFHKVDTLLVVVPHNYKITEQEKTDIENYVFWDQYQKKPVYIYKTELELIQGDELRHLQFYGPFNEFQLAEIQNIPIKQVVGGFLFNNELFTKPTDSFFYLNDEATRLYTCRNSTQEFHQYTNYAAGYFSLYIFRGNDVYLSGFCSSITGESNVNDITKMRKPYFKSVSTRHFDFELAKTLYTDSLRAVILKQADKYLEGLCTTLKTDTLDMGRMTTYVYQNMPELQQFLSMSPRMTILGKSFGSVNHVSTFDMTVFNHELAHTLIARKIGIQSNNFFCEGFAVYTGYSMDDSHYTNDLDTTTIHLDLLTYEAIFGDNHQFYSQPPMYPISGVFTRFIVYKIGIDTFKDIYAQQNMEKAFDNAGYPLKELIAEFKNSLDSLKL